MMLLFVLAVCCFSLADGCNVSSYTAGPGPISGSSYFGAGYHPMTNEIMFTPNTQATQLEFHRINCTTGEAVLKPHNLPTTPVSSAYHGSSSWHAGLKRMYWPPYAQAKEPMRVFFVPFGAALDDNWLYIDAVGSVVNYTAGVGAFTGAYVEGALCPNQQRLILGPYGQASQTNWHYIDCASATAVSYVHGVTVDSLPYYGGVYHPATDRVYFVPRGQADQPIWHHYQCATGAVSGYPGVLGPDLAWTGGGLINSNQIVFTPWKSATSPIYTKINSAGDADIHSNSYVIGENSYRGGATCAVGGVDRYYFAPYSPGGVAASWHYIQCSPATASAAPTLQPTAAPSNNLTAGPSASPTAGPTKTPTQQPSATPTKQPSVAPTQQPSATPASPTKAPTQLPTKAPTQQPSATPTKQPSATPTKQPSVAPTQQPSVTSASPTKAPTVSPSSASAAPSSAPTSASAVGAPSNVTSPVAIMGNVVFPSGATTTVSNGASLNATGSVDLGGILVLALSSKPPSGTQVVVPVVAQAQSISGAFSDIQAAVPGLRSCESVTVSAGPPQTTSFSVVVSVDSCACDIPVIVGGVVGGVILLALLALIIGCVRAKRFDSHLEKVFQNANELNDL